MSDFWMEHRYTSCNYMLPPHYENVYQILFLINGRIRYQVGDKEYEVSKGGNDCTQYPGGAYAEGAGVSL